MRILFTLLFVFCIYCFSFADEVFVLVDKNQKIQCVASEELNCKNTSDRLAILSGGGEIKKINSDDIVIGDTLLDDKSKKDSPKREENNQKKIKKDQDRKNAKDKLKALGLTNDEIDTILN